MRNNTLFPAPEGPSTTRHSPAARSNVNGPANRDRKSRTESLVAERMAGKAFTAKSIQECGMESIHRKDGKDIAVRGQRREGRLPDVRLSLASCREELFQDQFRVPPGTRYATCLYRDTERINSMKSSNGSVALPGIFAASSQRRRRSASPA